MFEDRYERDHKSPIQWRNRANDLRAAAAAIDFATKREAATAVVTTYGLGASFDMGVATRRVVWMLYGMALEASMKGILVARQQKPPLSHNLAKLARQIPLSLTETQIGVLDLLAHAVVWFGRYPVPTANHRDDVDRMSTTFSKIALSPSSPGSQFQRWNGALDWASLEELWRVITETWTTEMEADPTIPRETNDK